MAENKPTAYAFFGSGEAEKDNFIPLLDDELPQDFPDGTPGIRRLIRPAEIPRQHAGLRAVTDWLADQFGKRAVTPVDDVLNSLLAEREKDADVILVTVWPDEPTDDDLAIARRARDEGIRVKNLSAALDDLDIAAYEEPEVPEVTEEAPAVAALTTSPETGRVALEIFGDNRSADAVLIALRAFITDVVVDVLDSRKPDAADPAPAAEAPAKKDEPPFDGPYKTDADGATVKFYFHRKTGRYRPAVGRLKTVAGVKEEVAEMTKAEAADLIGKNLVDQK